MDDENIEDKTDKKKISLSMGDISGKVIKKKDLEDDDKEGSSKKDTGKKIMIPVDNKKISLREIGQPDFLKWVYSVMPVSKSSMQRLERANLEDYKAKKKLFEQVVEYHTKPMIASLKKAGYNDPPIM